MYGAYFGQDSEATRILWEGSFISTWYELAVRTTNAQGSSHGRKQILPCGLNRRAWKELHLMPTSEDRCTTQRPQLVRPPQEEGGGRKGTFWQWPSSTLCWQSLTTSAGRGGMCAGCIHIQLQRHKSRTEQSLEWSDSKLVTPPCCSQVIFLKSKTVSSIPLPKYLNVNVVVFFLIVFYVLFWNYFSLTEELQKMVKSVIYPSPSFLNFNIFITTKPQHSYQNQHWDRQRLQILPVFLLMPFF